MNRFSKDKLLSVGVIIITSILAVAFVLFLIYSTVYKVEPKILSVINYHSVEVEVKFLNNSVKLNPFETLTYSFNLKDDFTILATKTSGEEVNKIEVKNLNLANQLISVVLSSTKDYCFFSANVTNLYTPAKDVVTNINILSKEPNEYFVFGVDPSKNILAFAGSAKPSEESISFKEVKGHYPIECKNVLDNKNIENVVKTFVNYSPKEQLDYLNTKTQEINSAGSIEELDGI